MAFRPYKKPALIRDNARRGCSECDVTHEPFSCNEDWNATGYGVDKSLQNLSDTSGYDGEGFGEEIDPEIDCELYEAEEAERTYLFALMDEWYSEKRKENKAVKALVDMNVDKK